MTQFKPVTICVVALLLALASGNSADAKCSNAAYAKNIIFMVPDGMGLADVTAARIFADGSDGDRLFLEQLPEIGYQRTHSADSTVTDSAAAASAWATGEKYNNGEISCHDDNGDGACDGNLIPTILEIAESKGKATGLVVTSDITHATPAAFGANVHSRNCEEEIARQFLARDITVLLGGGIAANRSSCRLTPSPEGYLEPLLAEYTQAGYTIVKSKDEMASALEEQPDRLLGLFKDGGKTQELFRVDPTQLYPAGEPTLAEMAEVALDLLEKNKKGFFLMVEGSQIDWRNHANDINGQIAETLAFDQSVRVVLDWVAAQPHRKAQTLIVVVADHETGGFAVNGPSGAISAKGDIVEAGWTSDEHTAVDTVIWAQGPNSHLFGRALDNTDLYGLMKKTLK